MPKFTPRHRTRLKAKSLPQPPLEFTPRISYIVISMKTAEQHLITAEQLHAKLQHVKVGGNVCHYSLKKCEELAPVVNEINALKAKKNAIVLAHSYVSPEITYGVADFVGDSYELSKNALKSDAQTIVFAAVRFMGETAKILNPQKEVLIPGLLDGCTLADSINASQVRELRQQFPGYTFVCRSE